ncbi:MAG TPA: hypothetical protein DD827_01265 [Gammaproteobacteria bacterium]|nr:hypothetical protein [Gammaproteobacteria bacterium]
MAENNPQKLIVNTAFIFFAISSVASSFAQTPANFPPVQNSQAGIAGPFWNSQSMPPRPVQQQRQSAPVQNQSGNFSFQPRNRGYGNPGYSNQQAYGNRGGYQGQRPPAPPMVGYRPYPPPPQYRGGPGWGNGQNNFGPFGNGPFSGMPFGNGKMWSGGPFGWFAEGPKEGMANAWEEMLHAPSDMGDMPGGWSFPDISVPNPVDVGDQFGEAGETLATELPEFAREIPDMFNFRPGN